MILRTMRVGLGVRLFLGIMLVSLSGVAICAVLVDRNVRQSADEQVKERLTYEVVMLGQMTANALFGPIDPTDQSLSAVVKQLADVVHTNLSVLAPDGTVVADSEVSDVTQLGKQSTLPEIALAMAHGTGASVRPSAGEDRVFVAETIMRDGRILGIARASVPMSAVNVVASNVRRQMSVGGLAAAMVALMGSAVLALGILRPIRKLVEGAIQIGSGDLKHRVVIETNDEIGDLGGALNDMTGRLDVMMTALDVRNGDMRLVLDNVAQGLVTVDKGGGIAEERSKAVDAWFEAPRPGTKIWEMFHHAGPSVRVSLEIGWSQVFDGVLPLELALSQLPQRVCNGDAYFEIGYEPILDEDGRMDKCLIVVSDVTKVVIAENADAEQRELMSLFAAIAKDRASVLDFLVDTGDLVRFVFDQGINPTRMTEVKRAIHTIKGNSGLFGLVTLSSVCHDIETRMAESDALEMSSADRDLLLDTWAMMEGRARDLLGNHVARGVDVTEHDMVALAASIQQGKSGDALLRSLASWFMDPADRRLSRLAERAKVLAKRLGKEGVTIDVQPSTIRLPAERWAPFWNTMPHVVSNALDHGIEDVDERQAAGKPSHGRIVMSAKEIDERVVIEIADDGRGIHWGRVREKAARMGLPYDTEGDLVTALFTDGVTTRDEASQVSGRGVGLAAVRKACEEVGGIITVESAIGLGTKLRFSFQAPEIVDAVQRLNAAVAGPRRVVLSLATLPAMPIAIARTTQRSMRALG